jgi:hypothetical protein
MCWRRYASRLCSCELSDLYKVLYLFHKNYSRLSQDIRRADAAISLTRLCRVLYKHIRQAFHVSWQFFFFVLSCVIVRRLACETDSTGDLWRAKSLAAALGNVDASWYNCWISSYKILACDTLYDLCCAFIDFAAVPLRSLFVWDMVARHWVIGSKHVEEAWWSLRQ